MNADSWSAWGIWATWVTYVVIAVVAYLQVRETRSAWREAEKLRLARSGEAAELRLAQSREAEENRLAEGQQAQALLRAQTRPFVLVDAHFRSIVLTLAVRNIGKTAATDVVVTLDDRLTAAHDPVGELDWQDGTLFTSGLRSMAPDRELLFLLDRLPDRASTDLPMVITGTVSYRSHDGEDGFVEPFVVDLTAYPGALLPDKGLPELVQAIDDLTRATEIVGSAAHSAGSS